MDDWTKPSAAMMIAKVLELRETVSKKTKAYENDVKEDKSNIDLLENLLGEEINRLGGQSIKTAYGTAYRSTITSFRVANRETWVSWVIKNEQGHMLTLHVAKDAVKEYTDTNGLPPGLDMMTIHKTNVRSPSE